MAVGFLRPVVGVSLFGGVTTSVFGDSVRTGSVFGDSLGLVQRRAFQPVLVPLVDRQVELPELAAFAASLTTLGRVRGVVGANENRLRLGCDFRTVGRHC